MIYFLDSSALVKRYLVETGSDIVRRLLASTKSRSASSLSLVEVPAALRRKERKGEIDPQRVAGMVARLTTDMDAFILVDVRSRILESASDLVMSHTLRAYDAVQLASALHVAKTAQEPVTFCCVDDELRTAARAEGLRLLSLG